MICKTSRVTLILAVAGLGLTVDGGAATGAHERANPLVGTGTTEAYFVRSRAGALTQTEESAFGHVGTTAAATPLARKDCRIRPRDERIRRFRLCIRRTAWNFSNVSDNNFDPVVTPDGRFIAFASRDNLDDHPDDIAPANESEDTASRDIFLLDLQTGEPQRVSVDAAGHLARVTVEAGAGPELRLANSDSAAVSANGRLVAFVTDGALLPEDNNDSGDIYLKDVVTNRLTLVSAAGVGRPAIGGVPLSTGLSFPSVAISATGRFVAFMTTAALAPAHDHNNAVDVYVKDLRANRFFLASIDDRDEAGGVSDPTDSSGGSPLDPAIAISANGRFVAFTTLAALDPTDANGQADVYVFDRLRPRSTPILVSGAAPLPRGFDPSLDGALSSSPALSANGRFVAFESSAALEAGDANGVSDIYRYDRVNRTFLRVSLDAEGREATVLGSFDPAISANGRFVAFSSAAGDLVLGDTSFGFTERGTFVPQALFPEDIFVKDLRTAAVTRASLDEDGIEADGTSFSPSLSGNGRLIAFITDDSNLIAPLPGNQSPGDSVVVTEVDFQLPRLVDVPGDAPGAVNIARNFLFSPSDGFNDFDLGTPLDFALKNTTEQPGDQDWFRVFLFAAKTYQIDLEGRPTRQGTLGDPLLRILRAKAPDQDIEVGPSDDDGGVGFNARLVFQPRESGTYFISAESYGAATGTYRLLVRELPLTTGPSATP